VRPSISVDRPFASPAAKQLAAERGIDLSRITSGSGMDGMITTRDVENFSGPRAAVRLFFVCCYKARLLKSYLCR
jgi:pyruvate/2-oxoglutarate dehydrogenase complex dihydrolipoamide acyltransferase (E2) component